MFPQLSFLETNKTVRFFYGFLLILLVLGVFYLDVITKDIVAFDIFYFPFIMLITWYFGGRAGALMAIMAAIMWFIAQEDIRSWRGTERFYADGAVHLFTFMLICWMTNLIHKRGQQLEEKSRELARSNLELEQFAFRAAHDLQAPLATLHGYSEFLMEKKKNNPLTEEEKEQCVEGILKSVKRMSVMIKALLSYALVTKKKKNICLVNIGEVVHGVLETMRVTIAERKAEVAIDSLPVLMIDRGLAEVLFQNLISNALKYCERTPHVHISAAQKGKEWFFAVQDNGIGIPEADLKRVFVMFEKLPTCQDYPGSGIGLATCQKIVEHYHGRIWADSKLGEGSTFYFTFPAVKEESIPPT